MSEPEIHANPQRIQSLAEELGAFVAGLRSELERMNDGLHSLGGTWKDREYEKFKRSFERIREELGKIEQEVGQRRPELEDDARLLVEYLRKSQ